MSFLTLHLAGSLGPGGVHVTAMVRGPDGAHEARLLGAEIIKPGGRQGLAELAQMLSDGAITARIRSSGDIGDALTLLGQLRNGEIRGKAVIRLHGPGT